MLTESWRVVMNCSRQRAISKTNFKESRYQSPGFAKSFAYEVTYILIMLRTAMMNHGYDNHIWLIHGHNTISYICLLNDTQMSTILKTTILWYGRVILNKNGAYVMTTYKHLMNPCIDMNVEYTYKIFFCGHMLALLLLNSFLKNTWTRDNY